MSLDGRPPSEILGGWGGGVRRAFALELLSLLALLSFVRWLRRRVSAMLVHHIRAFFHPLFSVIFARGRVCACVVFLLAFLACAFAEDPSSNA